MFYSQYMSSFPAATGRLASRFAQRQYTRDTRVQFVCRRQRLYTREHAPAVDCLRNDDLAADGGAFMYLY